MGKKKSKKNRGERVMKMPNFCTPSTGGSRMSLGAGNVIRKSPASYISHWTFPCNSAVREMLT